MIKSAIHVATALCAYLLAFQLVVWPDSTWWLSNGSVMTLGIAALYATLATAFELLLKSERSSWRYVSIHDAFDLFRTTVLTAVTFLVVSFLLFRAQETRSPPRP
ncbi:MAG: hypothetical protein B7Z42_09505 [Brevundimonas sp. 12-68-7]|uniref:Uncharacterized protein n=1 Tax=Brevundimonas subvibrioides TaxID=74313 RepID=A0A258FLL1_9CAUL|nr:MAG: hypothetical protein B7Z42_09505 [Brevundimonas sp. 12-68-7]OYX33009.1 MAG: hypothetical protein B7Z01_10275 [Brevundimonas subvibrioides]